MSTISTTKNKGGRPQAVYHPKNGGDAVPGLMRLKDGRWRASGTDKYTFTEPDENRAIAHFLARKEKRASDDQDMVVIGRAPLHETGPLIRAARRTRQVIEIHIPADTVSHPVTVSRNFDTAEAWAWFADQVLRNPMYAAQRTGIEQLGYLPKVRKPVPSPKLADVGTLYTSRTDITPKELDKCRSTWAGFCHTVEVTTLRDLQSEDVAKWAAIVRKRGLAPKSVAHEFNRIKTILNHFRTTGVAIADVRHALDCCAVLKAPESTSLDPHPIARDDFAALLNATEDEGRAMLLVSLNLCFYPIDVARLRWDDLDVERGQYHAKRGKTKVARAAILWQRTIDALKALPHTEDQERVFLKENGQPHTEHTVRKWFFRLRTKAKVSKDVQFADIRDGAFTEAVAGEGVEFQHARVLAGHRSGIADAYVLRNPKMTAGACRAIELAYFG